MWVLPLFFAALVAAARHGGPCERGAAIESALRISMEFVEYFNTGELGQIFKRLMKQGATLTGTTAHSGCLTTTTNMRTTLIEQYQNGQRLESITKSTFYSSKDSSVVVSLAHLSGKMGMNPVLLDVKLFMMPEEGCTYKIQSMSQTPYGCLKTAV